MTTNRQLTATWTYHNGTKHSWESIRSDPHSLDWKNYPLAFKMYATLDPVPLPHEWPPVSLPTLSAIAGTSPEQNDECIPDLLTLAKLSVSFGGYHQTPDTRWRGDVLSRRSLHRRPLPY